MAAEAEVLVVAARPEAEANGDGAASKITAALGALGLVTISTAATLAASFEPAPGGFVADTYYHLSLAGTFLSGVTLVGASLWVSDNQLPAVRPERSCSPPLPPLLAAVGLSVATLLW